MTKYRDFFFALALLVTDMVLFVFLSFLVVWSYCLAGDVYPSGANFDTLFARTMFVPAAGIVLFPVLLLTRAYHMPAKWRASTAVPAALRAMLILIPAVFLILLITRFVPFSYHFKWGQAGWCAGMFFAGLFVSLIVSRCMMGKLQIELFRRGIFLRRSLVLGKGVDAEYLYKEICGNTWLGESPILLQEDPVVASGQLAGTCREHNIDIIWLSPPTQVVSCGWLPDYFFCAQASKITWRMLPEHFSRITKADTAHFSFEQVGLFYRRLEHKISLPKIQVVMIGSRGVPARYSGIETYIEEVGSHLVRQGVKVVVYCHARYITERGMYKGMELRFVPTIPTKHLETFVHTLLATLHALLHDEEIFHYHALGPSTMAWLPRLLGKKVVVSVQGLDWQRAKWGALARFYLKFGEWATAHFSHLTIVVSRVLWQHYLEQHHKKTLYIPNGFARPMHRSPDLIQERFGLGRRDYILFVGRLVPEKGCHTLIQAYRQLDTTMPLVLAGTATFDPLYRQGLAELAKGSTKVKFVGFVQDALLQELYSNAYLVVHPSELEGLSIALLEALSYENCVLASDRPENLEAIQGSGKVFKAGDAEDLTKQLSYLIDSPDEVQAVREQVRSGLRQLSDWQTITDLTLRAYRSISQGS